MSSNLRKLAYNRYYKRLQVLLDNHSGKTTLNTTITFLKNMESEYLDSKMTRLTDHIFLKDGQGIIKEQYKDILKEYQQNWRKFEIKRLILSDQYELAVMTALEGYHDQVEVSTNVQELLRNLHFITLLELASERSDTIILGQLLNILSPYNILTESNFSNLLINAMNNKDFETTKWILQHYTLEGLSDNILLKIGNLFIDNNQTDIIYEIMMLMTKDCNKLKLSLRLIGSMPVSEAFQTLDILIASSANKLYGSLSYLDMPSNFYQIKGTNNFEEVSEYLKLYEEIKDNNLKEILIECLLVSTGYLYTGFNSTEFILNYLLKKNIELKPTYINILCHNLSKTNLKITTLSLLELFKSKQIEIGESNFYLLVEVFFHGTEFDLLYLFVIDVLEQLERVPDTIRTKLMKYYYKTQDNNIKYILSNDKPNVSKFKDNINFTFILKNIENQEERTKHVHALLPGYFDYAYEIDMGMKNRIQSHPV